MTMMTGTMRTRIKGDIMGATVTKFDTRIVEGGTEITEYRVKVDGREFTFEYPLDDVEYVVALAKAATAYAEKIGG
jgi:hypothetical protein